MKRRLISALAALALLLPLCTTAPVRAVGSFPDVTDPVLAETVETLHSLGIVSGTGGGLFEPDGVFDRASFCKMALLAMNRGGEAAAQSGRVIFNDVTPSHWALGFVNAAAAVQEGEQPLIRGAGDGNFYPDRAITFAEAVTILLRALGYSDTELASPGIWYAGPIARAAAIGLTEGIARGGEETLSRAEAARLFDNLLFLSPKGSAKPWVAALLGGEILDNIVIFEATARTIRTVDGTYAITRAALPEAVFGVPVQLVCDRDGRVLTARTEPGAESRRGHIASAEARYLLLADGERVTVTAKLPVLQAGAAPTTYGAIYTDLVAGTPALLSYTADGLLSHLYLLDGSHNSVTLIAKNDGTAEFSALVGGNSVNLTVYKNGLPTTLSAARKYDVGIYSPDASTLRLSDRRLTGIYENLSPSLLSPERVTVMGAEFSVLDSALSDLAKFQLGDAITLLLTDDNCVAGAVKPSALTAEAIGVAVIEADRATVTLTWGTTVSGEVALSEAFARALEGRLVRVTSPEHGKLELTSLSAGEVTGDWNLTKGTLGERRVAPAVALYERAGASRLYRVAPEQVTVSSVPSDQILYARANADGEIDLLILSDVTGDFYTYGLATASLIDAPSISAPSGDPVNLKNAVLTVKNAKDSSALVFGEATRYDGAFAGIIPSLSTRGGHSAAARVAPLTAIRAVPRSAFRDGAVTIQGIRYPLSPDLDNSCYNAVGKSWFASLADARTFAPTLTVYFDKSPDQGGKVRVVVAE